MKIRHAAREAEKIELQMVPMIDIVFQLLIFFIMSFKIVLPEGDFNVRMPSAAAERAAMPSETLPIAVALKAGADGGLADVRVDGRSLGTGAEAFARLRQYIRDHVESAGGAAAGQELELDSDYGLQYRYVIAAMDAVTGYIENGQRQQLIEKIKFTPPKKPQ
jgi:biopolymer transport protein ExbD